MFRTLLALLVGSGLVATGLVGAAVETAEPAAATGTMYVATPILPSRVVVTTPTVTILGTSVSIDPPSDGTQRYFSHFSLVGQGITLASAEQFDDGSSENMYIDPAFVASSLRPGVYTAVGTTSQTDPDWNCDWIIDVTTTIKFGGNAGVSSSRQGSVVTVNGLFHEYRGNGYVYPAGRVEYLQRYRAATGWRTIASAPVDTDGRTRIGLVDRAAEQYRWVSVDNPLTFGFSSPSAFR